MLFSFAASENDSEPSVSSDSTCTTANIGTSFGDNFVDKKQTDKIIDYSVDEIQDNSSLSFEPLQDSREYISKSIGIYF